MFFSYFLSGFWSNICIFRDFLMVEALIFEKKCLYLKGNSLLTLVETTQLSSFRHTVNRCKRGMGNFKYTYIFIYALVLHLQKATTC